MEKWTWKPVLDDDQDEPDIPNSLQITVRFDLADDGTSSATTPESCQEKLPQTDGMQDGTDTDRNTSYTRDVYLKHHNPIPTDVWSTRYDLRRNLKPYCNYNHRH